jgi:hypothetical protein
MDESLSQKYLDAPTDEDAPGLKIVIKCCTSSEPKKIPIETIIALKFSLTNENSAAKIEPTCTPTIETPIVLGNMIPTIKAGKKRTKSNDVKFPLQPSLATDKPNRRLRIVPIRFFIRRSF